MPGAPEQGKENQSGEENQHKWVEFGFSYMMWTNSGQDLSRRPRLHPPAREKE